MDFGRFSGFPWVFILRFLISQVRFGVSLARFGVFGVRIGVSWVGFGVPQAGFRAPGVRFWGAHDGFGGPRVWAGVSEVGIAVPFQSRGGRT